MANEIKISIKKADNGYYITGNYDESVSGVAKDEKQFKEIVWDVYNRLNNPHIKEEVKPEITTIVQKSTK